MSGSDITEDAEAMEIIRKLRERGYTGSVVAQAMSRIDAGEVKLTQPQQELLIDAADGSTWCERWYGPAKRLVEMGLCYWQLEVGVGGRLVATAAGRAALAKSRETE